MATERRALGPRMMVAKRDGVIRATDQFIQSARPQAHAAPCRVWESLTGSTHGGGR